MIPSDLTRFAVFYYNSFLKYGDHAGVINYKDYAMREHADILDLERGQLGDIPLFPLADRHIHKQKIVGNIKDDTFKIAGICKFISLDDIVSKNGNLLLNIGPHSDGTIPEEVQQVLLDVVSWLNITW